MKGTFEEYLMPFSYNRMFKKEPRMMVSAEGIVLHTEAVQETVARLDYAP
jgi:hypothetical protein